jgi:hypothetical protein
MLTRFHHEIGLKIADEAARRDWIALVEQIADKVDELGLEEEILFHGTTIDKAQAIMRTGMCPTDAFEVLPDGSEIMTPGSFWGTVRTAAWYAEDTAFYRSGGAPAIIACPVGFLQTYATLGIDIPSRDFPQPGLSRLEDEEDVQARWAVGQTRSWQDSLADLGSLTALHDYELSLDQAVIVDDIESLTRILPSASFSS